MRSIGEIAGKGVLVALVLCSMPLGWAALGSHERRMECRALLGDVNAITDPGAYRTVFMPGGGGGGELAVTSEPVPIDKTRLAALLSKIIDKCGR